MKQKLSILWLMLLVGAAGLRAAEAYTYFDPSDGSLNFCYDGNRTSRKNNGYSTYDLNTGTNKPAWASIATQVKELYFYNGFADYRPTTCYMWAHNMTNLTHVTHIANLNTSKVTDMSMMFTTCRNLASIDVSGFNTSNVTALKAMFEDCSKLTTLAVGNWNTSNVTDFSGVFYGCSGLTSLDVSQWDTSKATTMRYMFNKCSSLTNLDLRYWKTSLVTSFYYMFANCTKLKNIYGITSLNTGTQNFVMTSNTFTVESMFRNCSSLEQLWLGNFAFSSSTATYKMLENCTGLKYLQVSNAMLDHLDAEACSGVGSATNPCSLSYSNSQHPSFTTITPDYVVWKSGYFASENYKPYAVYKDNTLTFYYDDYSASRYGTVYNLNAGSSTPQWILYHNNDVKTVAFYSNFANARPTTCYSWFSGMLNLTSVTGINYLNTSKVVNMEYMFNNCKNLTFLDLNWAHFTTDNVELMSCMFANCSGLKNLDIRNFNTAKVTSMHQMFSKCSALSKLDISSFNTSNVKFMNAMFQGCSSLTNLDVTHFNTEKAIGYMNEMFSGCSKLESLDLSSFTFGANADKVLANCSGLTYLKVPSSTNQLRSSSFNGVGTVSSPCNLEHPADFTPTNTTDMGNGCFLWKGGYFKDVTPSLYVPGDVNHDGSITVIDASLITEYVLGNTPAVFFIEDADVNNDGTVSVTDVSTIVEIVLGGSGSKAPATSKSLFE